MLESAAPTFVTKMGNRTLVWVWEGGMAVAQSSDENDTVYCVHVKFAHINAQQVINASLSKT